MKKADSYRKMAFTTYHKPNTMKNTRFLPLGLILAAVSMAVTIEGYAQTITQRIEYNVSIRSDDATDNNWYTDHIEASGRITWLESVMKDVRSGKVKAYDAFSEDFTKPLTLAEVEAILVKTDTMYMESPDPPYDLKAMVNRDETTTDEIDLFKFREQWVYDNKKGLIKQVMPLCP